MCIFLLVFFVLENYIVSILVFFVVDLWSVSLCILGVLVVSILFLIVYSCKDCIYGVKKNL